MFGVYSNKRLSQNERKILNSHPDDYEWYCIMLTVVFKENRFFQVREDIEFPKKDDDDGVVLIFEGGDVLFFKTISGDVTDDETDAIVEVCSFLGETFNQSVDAYILFPPGSEVDVSGKDYGIDINMIFAYLPQPEGEKTVERLENKLINNQEFSICDSIDHMLLPYTNYHDKEVFEEKYRHYMDLIESRDID